MDELQFFSLLSQIKNPLLIHLDCCESIEAGFAESLESLLINENNTYKIKVFKVVEGSKKSLFKLEIDGNSSPSFTQWEFLIKNKFIDEYESFENDSSYPFCFWHRIITSCLDRVLKEINLSGTPYLKKLDILVREPRTSNNSPINVTFYRVLEEHCIRSNNLEVFL